ncbi:MAG: T9SS type A sorting domain-containing protein [Flavobacteriales bacterium]
MNKFLILFTILFCSFSTFCQEVVNDLMYNTNLSIPDYGSRSVAASVDLPFFDDFSNYIGYPNAFLWQDLDVYVNRSLASNPINLGVATFDGLDSLGNPRNIFSEFSQGPSDFLTSQTIDISSESIVYFSFYFQAQGIGNQPESNDILRVDFLDSIGEWNVVWEINGQALNDFEKVAIEINDLSYLHDEFQFRFHNYSTLSGNFDHWHIDNVLLTEDLALSNENDDVAFVYETSKVLNFYTSIPWSHFSSNEPSYVAENMDSWLRNNWDITKSIDYRYDIYDELGLLSFHYPTTGSSRNDNIPSFQDENFSYSLNSVAPITLFTYSFSSENEDKASFEIIQSIATDDRNLFKLNDTLKFTQEFFNYYSLDDGTAEASYGVNVSGGQIALRYNISESDVLIGVQIHFEQNLEDASGSPFRITVWNEVDNMPNEIIYQSQIFYPQYTDLQNGFFEYVLEDPIDVSGAVFIGTEQSFSEILNVGLDKNTINNDRMFFNIGAEWTESNCAECIGTWMIRPVFGSLSSTNEIQLNSDYKIYPNPTSSSLTLEGRNNFDYKLFDLNSKLLGYSNSLSNKYKLDLSSYPQGIYFLQLSDEKSIYHKKIILQ